MMWGSFKYTVPLLLVSALIISIDQYVKKGRYWKIWASATFLGCFIFTLTFMAGSPGVKSPGIHVSPDSNTTSDEVAREDETGTKTRAGQQENLQQSSGQAGTPEQTDNSEQKEGSGQTTASQADLLLPVDEAGADAGFKAFRDSFLAAVNSKDLIFLKNHLSPNIRYSFGDNNGINGFIRHWRLDTDPGKSQVWPELAQVLTLGGSFDKNRAVFTAPYVFANFPETVDGFENAAVIEQNVSIHSEPSSNSPVLMGLSYKILKLADTKIYKSSGGAQPGESDDWRKVETSSGTGFINDAYIRSPIDYRAQFRQEDGQWKMIFFVAGD